MKKTNKQPYHFWQWLILSIARIKRLYFLAWGIVILLIIALYKTDIGAFLGKVW